MSAARLSALLGGAAPAEQGAGQREYPSATSRDVERRPVTPGPQASAGRGNLVRQAVTLLVHHPAAARAIGGQEIDAVGTIDRPGIPLLTELLAQLREDPPASTAGLLERWRDRPEYGSLAKLSVAVCIAPDEAGAAAELKSALSRLITEESPARRLDELLAKARDSALDDAEKQELQALLAARSPSGRRPPTPP